MSHVHSVFGEWCAKCVEHGVVEQVRRDEADLARLHRIEEAARGGLAEWDKAGIYLDPPAIAALRAALEEKP